MGNLTPRMRRFIDEYLVDLNATQAALRAGYSPKTAKQIATENLSKPIIQQAIQAAQGERSTRTEITQDLVLRELARLAFMDPRKFFHPDGSPIPIQDLDADTAACLAGLEVLEQYDGSGEERRFVGYLKKYRLTDKLGAITQCMKHLGLAVERKELTGKDGGPINLALAAPEAVLEYLRGLA